MPYGRLDLTGKVFGRLTAVKPDRKENGVYAWLCNCICGTTKVVPTGALTSGKTKSCGCWAKDFIRMEGAVMAAKFKADRVRRGRR